MSHPITIDGYLRNPVGKGSANVARRDMIRRNLEARYLVMMKQSRGMFSVENVFTDKAGNYIIHMKIPSEYYYKQGLVYDVAIQFLVGENNRIDLTLKNYLVRLYSNSPAFMFTYAYVYNQDDNIIPFLTKKLSSLSLTKKPVVRNPDESYGYEKSVYFAILYLREHPKVLTKSINKAKPLKIIDFLSKITSSVAKKKEYDLAKKKDSEIKKQQTRLKKATAKRIKEHRIKTSEQKSRKTINNNFKSVASKKNLVNMKHSNKVNMNIRKKKRK